LEFFMPRIQPVNSSNTPAASAPLMAAVKAKLGVLPAMFATWAHSTPALQAYLAMAGALAASELTDGEREIIALAVAQANECEYCLAAHTLLGKGAGLSESAITAARDGTGASAREKALAALAQQIVAKRGMITDAEFSAARAQLSEAAVLETIAVVALNIYTNYTNHIVQTTVDFPKVPLRASAALAA
jgi:uncharacterized peroxidase-related enzyme